MMAFPLAHPAAVLPLRRWFKWLSFPALVIGSLVPDAGYLVPQLGDLSHQFLGSILFGLPVGGLILAAFYVLRTPVVVRMPMPVRRSVLPVCNRPLGPLWIAVLSLLIGIYTHIVWDSVTHKDGWIAEHVPILLTPIFQFDGRTARLCNALWYISSFLGAGWLFLAFEKWKHSAVATPAGTRGNGRDMVQDAIFLAILVVPISLVHHLVRSPVGFVMTAAFCLFLGVLFIVRIAVTSENTLH
jgi:hypothetical protein